LRAAIQEANATDNYAGGNGDPDLIGFAIPGNGPHSIVVGSNLPEIADPVTIDGYTQGNATPETTADDAIENTATNGTTNAVLKIALSGAGGLPTGWGLWVAARDTTIRGLVINDFAYYGINVSTIWHRYLNDTEDTVIEGNFIGTDADGTADAGDQQVGISVQGFSAGTTIGGKTPAAHNLLSGNAAMGLCVCTGGLRVQGNLVGTDKTGATDLGNGGSSTSTVPGTGIFIEDPNNFVADNLVAFNDADGVRVYSSPGNRIVRNSIFSNGGLGINLMGGIEDANGVTANDPDDPDTGANELQNFPVITSAKTARTATTIKGTLNSTPGEYFVVQFFANPSGTDEGKTFIGQTGVSTNSSGDASFTFKPKSKVPVGQNITATATEFVESNTSEFSAPMKVARQR